ncbi:MAG: hypothetical protein WAL25_15065 [Acidimicrobiia bacterium]
MTDRSVALGRSGSGIPIRVVATAIVILSLVGSAVGLVIVQTLSTDARSSVSVSKSALDAISKTIDAVDEVASSTSASLDATAGSVGSASATLEGAVSTIDGVADFLESDLPDTVESIQMSMPAAIQTANAVDGTLRALSLFGVDYDPEESFGESLSRVNEALVALPNDIRIQSEALRLLTPSARELAASTTDLSSSLDDLQEGLRGFTSLTDTYEITIAEAETTVDATGESLDTSIWLVRALVIGAGIVGVLIGTLFWSVGRRVDDLTGLVQLIYDAHRLPATTGVE